MWILLSDRALAALARDAAELAWLQTFKGGAFVLVTSLLLWFTVRSQLLRAARGAERRLAAEQARAEAEAALRRTQEKFTHAFEHSPAAISLTRLADGTVLEVNATWEELFGYSRGELIGRAVQSLWKDRTTRMRLVQDLRAARLTSRPELELVDRHGRAVVVDLTARLIALDGEEVVLTTLLDVRRRREEQAARERQQRRIAMLADISHRLVVAADPRAGLPGIFRDLVRELDVDFCAYFRREATGDRLVPEFAVGTGHERAEDVAGLEIDGTLCGLVAQQRAPVRVDNLQESPLPQEARPLAAGLKCYSGHPLIYGDCLIGTLSFGSRSRAVFAEEDVHFMETVADQIAASLHRVRLLEALQASDERFRQMAESIADVFWMVEVDTGAVLYVSPAYERIWGRPVAELAERPEARFEAIVPEDRERVKRAVARQAEGLREDYRILRPDGSVRWIADRGYPVPDANGRIYRVVGVARDITERKQLEEQYLRAQRMEAVGTLASGVAHDLNNILAPVMMVSALLRRKYQANEDQMLIGLVEQSAQRGAGIVTQLLTFSRGLGGEKIELQAAHLVKEVAHLLEETLPRNITVSRQCGRDVPTIVADPTQVHQVLMNLCVNARDAMPAGGQLTIGVRRVELPAERVRPHDGVRPGTFVVLSVEDTGQGIPPEIRHRIFDPFFTTKAVGKGTGLGLATVVGIVRGHGGFVEFESESGRGTRFEVHLPAGGRGPCAVATTGEGELPRGHGECVLVVDDEKSIRLAMREVLESRGFRTLVAEDGAAALELFRAHTVDVKLVITDLMMPGIDGLTLAPRLRELKAVPVILCSGAGQEFAPARLAEAGVHRALAKPLTARALLETVTQALR